MTASLPNGTRLTFDNVTEDSRCPADAQCIWAGDGVVAVTLQTPKGPAESRELHTQTTRITNLVSDYTIKLTALAPILRSSQEIQPADYIATFVVTTTPPRLSPRGGDPGPDADKQA